MNFFVCRLLLLLLLPFHFSQFSEGLFLNIPLFDVFIRIPKMKSDKPRAQGERRRHTYDFAEKNKVIWSSLQTVFFLLIYIFFVLSTFFFFHYASISRYFICFFVVLIFHLLTSFSFFLSFCVVLVTLLFYLYIWIMPKWTEKE